MLADCFKNGINLGGWLSQYDCLSSIPQTEKEMERHLSTYITEKDIAQIAGWGFDHVRLPVDYKLFEGPQEEKTFRYIEQCLEWCRKFQLNAVIDLHNAEGNVYGKMDAPMPLLTEEKLQQKFIGLWEKIAIRFRGIQTPVLLFELLNEVSDGSGYLWNRLYRRTVEHIRQIDGERGILIGSNEQNSPFRLKELELLAEENIIYNFHFYDPQVFTHQRAAFSEEMTAFDRVVHYPGEIFEFTDFLQENRQYIPKYVHVAMENRVDRERMTALLKDAFDFKAYSGRELYCGEFGVIDCADDADAARWLCDCMELLEEKGIGHCLWNYKALNFGLVDETGEAVSEYRIEKIKRRSYKSDTKIG